MLIIRETILTNTATIPYAHKYTKVHRCHKYCKKCHRKARIVCSFTIRSTSRLKYRTLHSYSTPATVPCQYSTTSQCSGHRLFISHIQLSARIASSSGANVRKMKRLFLHLLIISIISTSTSTSRCLCTGICPFFSKMSICWWLRIFEMRFISRFPSQTFRELCVYLGFFVFIIDIISIFSAKALRIDPERGEWIWGRVQVCITQLYSVKSYKTRTKTRAHLPLRIRILLIAQWVLRA